MRPLAWTRWPLRLKLTLVFVGVMGLVLAAIGSFLFFRTKDNLDSAIQQSLNSRSGDLVQSARSQAAEPARRLIEPGEGFAQVLTADGRVLDSRPQGGRPLLRRDELARATREKHVIERHERDRLLVAPVRARGRTLVAVVDAPLRERERALEGLGGALLIGGPLALLTAGALAYVLSGAALHPVELMRFRASQISGAEPTARLPVPDASDEIQRLANTLNEMLARLAEAAEHERAFVANASHELRTPIATIRTELELADRHGQTIDDFRNATRAAIVDAEDLGRLADDLLVLEGADRGTLPLRPEEIDIGTAFDSAVENVRHDPMLGNRHIIHRANGPRVTADPDRLMQALNNMIRNAVLHGRGTITGDAITTGDAVEISVSDQGRPVPETVLRTAFDRFSRAPDAINRPGAGLGLAIVREIARAHGGHTHLENTSAGVRCVLVLPASQVSATRKD